MHSCFNPLFKINAPFFCWTFFFKEYLNSQVRTKKIVNSVEYHTSPSFFTLVFQIYRVHIAGKWFVGQENESRYFNSCPKGKFFPRLVLSPPRKREINLTVILFENFKPSMNQVIILIPKNE